MPDLLEVIGALMEAAPPVLQRDYTPDCCILATRMTVEALDVFGVRARPQSVSVLAFNQDAVRLLDGGMTQEELRDVMAAIPKGEPGGPWVLGVDPNEQARDGRFNGHLVAVADGLLIDLSLPQLSRPHKGIKLDPAVLELGATWETRGIASFERDGVLVGYQRVEPDNRVWAAASDWTWPVHGTDGKPRRALHRANAGEIIRAMRAELGASR